MICARLQLDLNKISSSDPSLAGMRAKKKKNLNFETMLNGFFFFLSQQQPKLFTEAKSLPKNKIDRVTALLCDLDVFLSERGKNSNNNQTHLPPSTI